MENPSMQRVLDNEKKLLQEGFPNCIDNVVHKHPLHNQSLI